MITIYKSFDLEEKFKMNDIASLIEVAYCLPEKFNSLECGACSLEEIETKK